MRRCALPVHGAARPAHWGSMQRTSAHWSARGHSFSHGDVYLSAYSVSFARLQANQAAKKAQKASVSLSARLQQWILPINVRNAIYQFMGESASRSMDALFCVSAR